MGRDSLLSTHKTGIALYNALVKCVFVVDDVTFANIVCTASAVPSKLLMSLSTGQFQREEEALLIKSCEHYWIETMRMG